MGARVGLTSQINHYANKRAYGYGYKMEFGIRPAPTSERLWMNFQVYYLFNIK